MRHPEPSERSRRSPSRYLKSSATGSLHVDRDDKTWRTSDLKCGERITILAHAMSATNSPHPPGFRARRGLNWGCVGLLYTSFYMCRYNLPIANSAISAEFGFSKSQMGWIISIALFAYACGQIINGLLTDRLGGKRAMLIGAAGTIVMNTLFGIASFAGSLALFVTIRGIDAYLQAFGAPGMVKINAAWFRRNERGRFAGIFGFMINAGRFLIGYLGPALLAGFMLFGLFEIPPRHWRWLFWVPAGITAAVALVMALSVKDTPQQAGFPSVESETAPTNEIEMRLRVVLKIIATNPVVWVVALAYACTGAVRQGIDQWFPRFMQEVHQCS
jgi:MFS transporter, OPA family, glycerol-3-phosphate transporter